MTTSRQSFARWLRQRLRGDGGFTLVEVIIAVSLLGLITGAGTASLLTAVSAARSSTQSSHESNDAQLISAFLVKDAQAAGGTDPATGTADANLGISFVDGASCAPAGIIKAQFRWIDRVAASGTLHTNAASYSLDTATHQLSRRSCRDGVSSGDMVLGSSIASVSVNCYPAGNCPGLPDTVTFTIAETNSPAYSATAFTYDLTAQFRPQVQTIPSSLNSGAVPLLALGGAGCPPGGALLSVNGTAGLVVQLGGAIINSAPPGCTAMSVSGAGSYLADSTSILWPGTCTGTCPSTITSYSTPLLNPLASLPPPPNAGACASTPGNPPLTGAAHYQPGVYKNAVTIGPGITATFDAGTYVFCAGLDIKGIVIAPNVLFYFAGGSLKVNSSANVTLGSQTSGVYSNVSMWFTTSDPVTINGGAGIDSYKGIIYAPLAVVSMSGGSSLQIGSVIAYAISMGGTGFTTLGPAVAITTADLLPAYKDMAYIVTMAAAPTATYTWTSSALPAGLTISTTGVISGTPTTIGVYPVTITATDSSSSKTASRPYTLNVGSGSLAIVPPFTLLDATVGTNYSATIVASGGTGGYAWTAPGLPNGLSMGGLTGVISGIPTVTGMFPITVTVTDGATFTVSQPYSLVVNNLPVIGLPLSLPDTTVGASYLVGSSVGGGSASFTWTIANQPAWLNINFTTGLLTGTPTTAGNYPNVIITATDRNFAVASKTLPLKVNVAPAITAPATLPGWAVGAVYPSTTMSATGGTGGPGSYTWSAVGLPSGLTMSPAGIISGIPSTAGTYGAIVVKVTDGVGVSVTRPYSITITGALSITAPANLPSWDAGAAYPTTTPTAGGGSGGFVWSSGSLPPGLVINSSSGAITGTPTTVGPYSAVVLKVTDSNGVIATRSYSMTVYSPLAFTGPGSLPNWVAGIGYPQQTATVSGGSGSNTWTASGLPPGLTLSAAGLLSGTPLPTGIGTYASIVLSVGDGTGGGFNIGPYSITIFPALAINTGGVPSNGIVGAPFTGSLSASGGTGNFSWSAAGLPAGVSISPAGVLSGTPQTNAAYTATFTLTDNGTGGIGGQPATTSVTVPINTYQPLSWGTLPTPPAAWTAGFAYPTQTFVTMGGASVTWLITGLPAGMSSSGGAISGTPSTAVATTVTVKATDSIGQTLTRTFSLTINSTLTLSQSSTPTAAWTVGRSYPSVTFSTTGGTPAVSVGATGVPAGMSFSGGVLSGTPTTAGSSSVTVTATDAGGGNRTSSFTLTINAAPSLSGTLAVGDQSIGYSSSLSLTGGTGSVTWTAPTKPAFLSINASTGLLTGTPVSAGSFPVTVTVTDATGATATANVTLTVRPPTPISVSLNNGTGTVKKIDQGDTILITYSQALDLATVCPGGALPLAGNGNVTVTVNNGAGAANDTITVTAASCTGVGGLHLGTINLGSGAFVSANTTFSGSGNATNLSTISWVANALTITLGKQSPANSSVVVSVPNTATYAPDPAMRSSAGVFVSGTASVTGSSPNFFF